MNSEKFQLGAGNAKGVYDLTNPDRGEGVPQKELWERRTKDEFMPNAAARVEATLRLNGYRQIVDLGNGVRYPSVDEWIASKIGSNEGWTRTYPAFIQDEESNEIFFCKSRIKPLIKMIGGGFLAEKDILTSVPNLPAPRLIRYIPENNASGELETLIFEAIKFSKGSVLQASEWTEAAACNAAIELKKLEDIPLTRIPEERRTPHMTYASILRQVGYLLEPSLMEKIKGIFRENEPYTEPVLVHGDAWPKNIIVGTEADPRILFVDWELAGAGYRGQDIARLWWSFATENSENRDASSALLATYLDRSQGEESVTVKNHLRFGVAFEVLLELDNAIRFADYFPGKQAGVRAQIASVHTQAQRMLKTVDGLQ